MKIYHILAMSENRVIGVNNELPWSIEEDMQRYKQITYGHSILMGRKTFESIGKPLKKRNNIVVSSKKTIYKNNRLSDPIHADEIKHFYAGTTLGLVNSIEAGLEMAKDLKTHELYIIGGGEIYKQTLPYVDEIRMTIVHDEYDGDAFYPEIDDSEWATTWAKPGMEYSFVDLVRKSSLSEVP